MEKSGTGYREAAVEALKTEHRNLAKVLHCLEDEVACLRGVKDRPDLDLLYTVLYYIRVFPDQYHHPKEEEFLFARLRERSDEAPDLLDMLDREHGKFARMLKALERALQSYDEHFPDGLDTLERLTGEYLEFQWEHMRKEEERVIPIAERVLTDEDWHAINNAFLRHDDPMFGDNLRTGFEVLLNRIMRDSRSRTAC